MKPSYYWWSDYAGFESNNLSCYYGYEVTQLVDNPEDDEDTEWCFEAKFNNERIIIPYSKLNSGEEQCEVLPNLLKGIGWILTKYKLTLRSRKWTTKN